MKRKAFPETKKQIKNEIKYINFSRPEKLNSKIKFTSIEIFGKKIHKSPHVFHKVN